MINVIAPPGCYGTYIARCLHHYSSIEDNYLLDFDQYGSSHAFRKISSKFTKTSLMHWSNSESISAIDGKNTIVITSDSRHWLDYFDNQFYKQSQGNLIEYLTATIGADDIQDKIEKEWGHTDKFDHDTPRWLIREYCSFWQFNTWTEGYNNDLYLSIPHDFTFCCQDLWNVDIFALLNNICKKLSLKIHAPSEIIYQNHQNFLNCQHYHNIQTRCEQFAADTINLVYSESPCVSIFDEAHVQYVLRNKGYEIRCHDLNKFPTTSIRLADLIYETSNHHNPRRSQYQN
jgi:hypothetical protein